MLQLRPFFNFYWTKIIMQKIMTSFFSGLAILALTLTTYPAFSKETSDVTALIKKDSKVGTGTEAVAGKTVDVHYTGWLYDPSAPDNKGTKFDSSRDRGDKFSFPLGAGRVIQGWDQGVAGMKIGGQRTLIIPAEMGYGARGAGGAIPPQCGIDF